MLAILSDIELAKKTYRNFFGKEPKSFSIFSSGLTNVVIRFDDVVIRIKKGNDFGLYSKENELGALKETSQENLGTKILFINKENMTLLYRYFEGESFLDADLEQESLKASGHFLHLLHSLRIEGLKAFDAKKRFDTYKREAKTDLEQESEKKIRTIVEKRIADEKQVFSHNDIVCGNFLRSPDEQKLALIDYEYAGTNNEMFDLSSLLSENNIENISQKKALLEGYFEKPCEKALKSCNEFILYQDYLWYYWAIANFKITKDQKFKDIAKEKQNAISLHEKLVV